MAAYSSASTESREYCFVIMSYKNQYDILFERIRDHIEKQTGLRCIRADREPRPGVDLLGKVHEMIMGASVVLADVTEHSPNVYYEYGFATAHDRRPILFLCDDVDAPTDLVGAEALRYKRDLTQDQHFFQQLVDCVNRELRSPLPEQRRMLVGAHPFPAFIIAAPRVPSRGARRLWQPDDSRTFGDNLGIAGILTAYGNLFGTRRLPELLHANYTSENLLQTPGNFFCIGSPKVNPASEELLTQIQANRSPNWTFEILEEGSDTRVIFRGDRDLNRKLRSPCSTSPRGTTTDYGLIVRAPHPRHPQHVVLIVAGRHSIGTQSACLVVTQQKLIMNLEKELTGVGISMRDTSQPFWAVVAGELQQDRTVSEDIRIVKVGGYV